VKLVWLILFVFVTGCAATQDRFCSLIEPDSYLLVSIARCETIQVSFDYVAEADFSVLDAYDWLPAEAAASSESGRQDDNQLHEWVTAAVDAGLMKRGFNRDSRAPDFLVDYGASAKSQGTLTLAILLPGNRQLIWRGTANDKAYPARNQGAQEQRIRTAVGRLLEQFPPAHSE
jgi:hypothetical protein